MAANDPRRVHVRIRGRVQGVFYRESAKRRALALSLKGFVRNLPDGTVEAFAEGPAPAVEEFVTWCRGGPPSAKVDAVEVTEQPATGEEATFRVER